MEAFIGTVIAFAGSFAPQGWALCDGRLMKISENQALFSILGTTYGGDGSQTFGLPNLMNHSLPHEGANGTAKLNYILCLNGIYPPRA